VNKQNVVFLERAACSSRRRAFCEEDADAVIIADSSQVFYVLYCLCDDNVTYLLLIDSIIHMDISYGLIRNRTSE
jgi:hypothetical protein